MILTTIPFSFMKTWHRKRFQTELRCKMRVRSNAEIRLDYYQHLVNVCILRYQNISTGLIVNASAVDGDSDLWKNFHLWNKVISKDKDVFNAYMMKRRSPENSVSISKSVKFDLPEITEEQEGEHKHHEVLPQATEDSNKNHSWVRDNIYCIMCVWGLTLAYRKMSDMEDGKAKAYEHEKTVVKAMRGLLCSMQMQTDKVEKFKITQNPRDALHAKYSSINGKTVVGDLDWGHLQIDSTSLFLLTLAQMTATGIVIVFTLDEVAFIQNLVFYIETAYRTPDYGIWERGDKTNHGLPELNASSVGLAKAALEALNGLDLFGARGGPHSVIHVLPDETHQCQAILMSMLPRESISKETDAALLTVIGFPAFAVDDPEIIAITRKNIRVKLEGAYGYRRFLRDGYKTAREDPKRLHYEPWELMAFENIECEWPLFFAFLILDGLFNNKIDQVEYYKKKLEDVMLVSEDGIPVVPELYGVPEELVDKEYAAPSSQRRRAMGKIPHMWSQSMYILGQLIIEGFISPGELDPLNRRHVTETKPEIVVQVVILCEDTYIQDMMAAEGLQLQTVQEVAPFHILPSSILSKFYKLLGRNKQAGLTGRSSSKEIGLLATSKLYMLSNKILAFTPQVVDGAQFYLGLDVEYLVDDFTNKIDTLRCSWKEIGRPVIIYKLTRSALGKYQHLPNSLLTCIKKLQGGNINGTRVILGTLSYFQHTSCIIQLNFLADIGEANAKSDKSLFDQFINQPVTRSHLSHQVHNVQRRQTIAMSHLGVLGITRRTRSIQILQDDNQDVFSLSVSGRRQSRHSIGSNVSLDFCETLDVADLETKEFHKSSNVDIASHLKGEITDTRSGKITPTNSLTSSSNMMKVQSENDCYELVQILKESYDLQEQVDILHFLFVNKGPSWDTKIVEGSIVTVKHLLKELYVKVGNGKLWWLVRHTAGLLDKRVGDLALAVTDLLVRQKQLSVGLPPDHEISIISPLPPDQLAVIILTACGTDFSTTSLTQEVLVYLAMFIRTEPHLFADMLRLRVGLMIQVMMTELSRSLNCSGDDASDSLMNLSPFEVKTLLHHILSGKEIVMSDDMDTSTMTLGEAIMTQHRRTTLEVLTDIPIVNDNQSKEMQECEEISEKQGQWLRRRRLDGSLNRIPMGFYTQVWELLRRCHSLILKGNVLLGTLTREMTKQEFKFALLVDTVLNSIPQPEYKQLMVEATIVLSNVIEIDNEHIDFSHLDMEVDKIIHEANNIFIRDVKMPPEVVEKSRGPVGICLYFYDIAPSGRYGTMTYMAQALANQLSLPVTTRGLLDCCIS